MDHNHGILTRKFSKNKQCHRNVHRIMLNYRKVRKKVYMLGTQDHEIAIYMNK